MPLKPLILLFSSLFLISCIRDAEPRSASQRPAPATAPTNANVGLPTAGDRTFSAGRVGGITGNMTMAQIEQLYGSGTVESRKLDAGEGTTVPGYAIFPGTRDELLVTLDEDNTAATVRIHHPQTTWYHASAKLTVGTPLHELTQMNGTPFEFRGWGWDYGGTVTNWKSGKLYGIRVRLDYDPARVAQDVVLDEIMGDVPIMSDDEAVEGMGVRVSELAVDL